MRSDRLNFNEKFREELPIAEHPGIEAGRQALLIGLLLDGRHEHVAVGQRLDVVVREILVAGILDSVSVS